MVKRKKKKRKKWQGIREIVDRDPAACTPRESIICPPRHLLAIYLELAWKMRYVHTTLPLSLSIAEYFLIHENSRGKLWVRLFFLSFPALRTF